MAPDFIPASIFFKGLGPDEKVFFLVRHGERGHIMPNDPNHGAFVGLTERGREQALNLGKDIAAGINASPAAAKNGASKTMSFFSSPVGRCMQTAEFIGRGFHQNQIPFVEPVQSLAEYFVKHYEAYMETHRTGFYEGICRWLDGTAEDPNYVDPAYFPLADRCEELLQLMLAQGHADINIFATHDAWIVPCLTHYCGMKFSPQRWMNFLTGMVVVASSTTDGSAPEIRRIVPVTALKTGWMLY